MKRYLFVDRCSGPKAWMMPHGAPRLRGTKRNGNGAVMMLSVKNIIDCTQMFPVESSDV